MEMRFRDTALLAACCLFALSSTRCDWPSRVVDVMGDSAPDSLKNPPIDSIPSDTLGKPVDSTLVAGGDTISSVDTLDRDTLDRDTLAPPAVDRRTVHLVGRVVDRDGNPLPDAIARISRYPLSDTTDFQGFFELV